MIKVLLISKRFPMNENKAIGSYICNRVIALKKIAPDIQVSVGIPVQKNGFFLRIIKKIMGDESYPQIFNPVDIEAQIFKISYKLYPFDYMRGMEGKRLGKALKKFVNDYDLVHAHFFWEEGIASYLATKNTDVKIVITAHGVGIDMHLSNKKYRTMILESMNNCDAVCFDSESLKQTALKKGLKNKGFSINNGVDMDLFNLASSDFKKKYAPNGEKIVGYVGNFVKAKGADRLPEICSDIYSEYKNCVFLFIGSGLLQHSVREKMDELGLPNYILGDISYDDMPAFFNAMDIMIAPSRREAFGCAALEARACGVLVVAPKLGGFLDSVGDGGILVHDYNSETSFAKAVVKQLKTNIDRNAISRTASRLTWEKTALSEAKVYRMVMNEK